jgi:DnaJ homolog subfamily A member 2
LEGLEGGGGGEGSSAEDIFSMFFGGGGRGRPRGPQKGEDIVHTVKASLEDLYNGKTVRLAISRNKPCEDCQGRGGKEGAEKACTDCNGRGIRVSLRQIGPGMVQQVQSSCPACSGNGKIINEKDKCKSCKGNKVYKDRKVLEVNIEKGMVHGQKIKFSGEADEIPGTLPGDVIIVIQEKEHETFRRKGADLVMAMELELQEALCGFVKTITHLDNRVLKIEIPPGKVVKHDSVKLIGSEGMPQHGNIFNKGGLFVHFKVKFPSTVTKNVVETIKKVLPLPPSPMLSGEEEECNLADVDISQFGKSASSSRSAYEDDEDEDGRGGAQKVQCGQN